MFEFLRKRLLLQVPEDDRDRALVVRVFNTVCVSIMGFLIVSGIGAIFIFVRKTSSLAICLVLMMLLLIALWTAHRGRIRHASMMLICGFWGAFTVTIWLSGTVNTVLVGMYIFVIAMAGALIGQRFAVIIALMSVASAFGLSLLQSVGYTWPSYYPMPPWSAWYVLLFTIILIVPTTNGVVRAFSEASRQASQEIETRLRAEEIFRTSEERYRFLFEQSANAVAVYKAVNDGEDFIFVDMNKAGEQIEQISRKALIGHSVLKMFPAVMEFGLFDVFRRVWRTGEPERHPAALYRDERIDGWRDNHVYRLPSGEIVAVYSDETDRKRAEEELRNQVSLMESLLEAIPAPVFFKDTNHIYLGCNEAFAAFIGLPKENIIGRSVVEIAPLELANVYRAQDEALFKNPMPQIYESSVKSSDGTTHDVMFHKATFSDSSGAVAGLIGVILDITDRKKAEEALRESEQRLSLALAGANFGIWEWNLTTGKAVWDDRSLSVLGYESDEFEPSLKNWKKVVHPEDWPRVAENLNLHLEGKLPTFEVEYRILNKSGDWQWALARGNVTAVDEVGKPTRMAGVFADITERKKTEEALRSSEAKYRFLTEHASDLIWTLDLNLRTTFVTPSVEKVLGFSPEERMLQKAEDQLTPESLQLARQRLVEELSIEREQGIQEDRSVLVDLDYYHKNGSIVCLQTAVTFIRDEKGIPIGLHGISRDVTELKRTQEALRESEEKYRTVVEESFDGIFVHNGTVITFANSRLHEMLGYERGELQGLNCGLIFHPDYQDMTRSRAQARLRGEPVIARYEVNLLRKDGTSFPGEVNAKVIVFDEELQIQVWIRDLTEQKRLEKGLVEAQKMEAIGTLTGGIAHDFNNLLTVVNGYTEMILLDTDEDDPRYDDLRKVLETGRKGAELVQRLLAFSKKGESSPHALDLNRVVENSVVLLNRTLPKMIEVETVLGSDLYMVNADDGRVEQVVMNLCINAKEAMPTGGKLRIETRNVTVHETCCSLHVGAKPGPHVLIEVTDTGGGMDAETVGRIFDPFFTTKGWDSTRGTGLGLSVAKGIVEQHGGWMTCESEPGKGTTFSIYFPAMEDAPAGEKPKPLAEIVRGTEKILLVDDEEYVRDLGKRILERSGYSVITASNGQEALDIYERERSSIALVLLDLIMPEMGGEKCLERLFEVDPYVKVIISSGHSLDPNERDRLGDCVKGFINKPYQTKRLLEVVGEVLKAPQGHRTPK